VQFYRKCAVLVLIYAALTAHLQQCDATSLTPLGELTALLQTSWLERGRERERKGRGGKKGKASEREKEGRKEEGDKGKGGRRKETGKERKEFLCSCDFSLGKLC